MSYWEAAGQSNEWYTPPAVFEALGCMFDMDVAAPMLLPSWVGDRLISKSPDGGRKWLWKDSLESEWAGFIWMNPPFGGRNAIGPWLDKFIAHGNGIALTPDRTSAPWFQRAAPRMDSVLFTRKLRFIKPCGSEGKSPSNGTALMAIGPQGCAALRRAAGLGFGILLSPSGVSR